MFYLNFNYFFKFETGTWEITGHPDNLELAKLWITRSLRVAGDAKSNLLYFQSPYIDDSQKEKRLLYLFLRDLLPYVDGRVVDIQCSHYYHASKSVSLSMKVLGISWLLFSNAGILVYLFYFRFASRNRIRLLCYNHLLFGSG